MTILYVLVARGSTILAEYTTTSGNFPQVTRTILTKIKPQDSKMSYVYDDFVFHYLVEDGLIFLCMCDESSKRRIPFQMLEDIKNRFLGAYGDRAQTAIAFAMNEDFGRTLQKQLQHYNSPEADMVGTTQKKLDDVKDVMVQNIEMVLERGEKLELLVDKTNNLQLQSFKFQSNAKALRHAMFMRKVKMYALVFFVVALIMVILSAIVCGGIDYPHCQ